MDTSTEQETFEPTREQLARVERLAIEHGSVEVKIDKATKIVRVRPTSAVARGSFAFDENGDDVSATVDRPTTVEVHLPVDLVKRLIGPGVVELAIDGVMGMDAASLRPWRLGVLLADEIVAEIEQHVGKADVGTGA